MNTESPMNSPFDSIRRVSSKGIEYWMARELYPLLGYAGWENFPNAIAKAKKACEGSGENPINHFRETTNMVQIGSGAKREMENWFLDRYACYLVAMNSDTTKAEVGLAQAYFAIQTRRQEITDGQQLSAGENRATLRERVKTANKNLASTAKSAGVQSYGLFYHAGHIGFYKRNVAEVKARKGISPNDDLLDCIGSLELSAHQFKAELTKKSIEKKSIKGQHALEAEHKRMGKVVRDTVHRQTETYPEDLPAEPSIKKLSQKASEKQLPPSANSN